MIVNGGVTLAPTAGTITLNGAGAQSVTSSGASYYNLTNANTSGNALGVTFTDGFTVAGTFTALMPDSRMVFHAGSVYDLMNINIAGTAGHPVLMESSGGAGTSYTFRVRQAGEQVRYADIQGADNALGQLIDASDSDIDSGDNVNWLFIGPLDHFTLDLVTLPQDAGTARNVRVTAYDTTGHVKVNYTGTVRFMSSDGLALLPGEYAFTGGDAGEHLFTSGVTFNVGGTQSLTVTDTIGGQSGTRNGIAVTAAPVIVPPLTGEIDLGSGTLMVEGSLQGSVLTGSSPSVIVTGQAGSRTTPLEIDITGMLALSALGMTDNVSVNIRGSGAVTFRGNSSGLVYLNGELKDHTGQSAIRGMLNQNMSELYRRPNNPWQDQMRIVPASGLVVAVAPGAFESVQRIFDAVTLVPQGEVVFVERIADQLLPAGLVVGTLGIK